MPSEPEPRAATRSGRFAWLRSEGLGLLCGQATVLLLGVGSLVLARTRDGASAEVAMDDLTAFFRVPSPWHAWLYLLVPVLGLYALNTLLCTWDSVLAKWRRGVRELSAYAPALIHLSFLLALFAHGVGGLWNREGATLAIGPVWQPLADGRQVRLAEARLEPLPNSQLKSVEARLELRDAAGRIVEERLGYNQPVSSGGGARLLLLSKVDRAATGARFASGSERCVAAEGAPCSIAGLRVELTGLYESGHWGQVPMAVVHVASADGLDDGFHLLEGQERRLPGRAPLRFERLEVSTVVVARSRTAPGNPWALGSAALLVAGLALMGRRWVRLA